MSHHHLLAPLFAALLLPLACSDDSTDPPDSGNTPADSGVSQDSGVNTDGGVNADSGLPPPDAGFDDAGLPVDSGTPADSGTPTDTGVGDAGPAPTCDPNFGAGSACGGNPVGNWTYRAACTSANIFQSLATFCNGQIQFSNQAETASGTLELTGTATAGSFTRDGTSLVTVSVSVPTSCVPNCGLLASTLEGVMGVSADCQTAGGICDCRVERSIRLADQGTYVVNGNVITAFGSGGTTFDYDYCVANNSLVYKGQAGNATDKELVYVLER
ncbi:MAG: hypothetical protein IPG45_17190 [Deltaproteobacteria bacterium]|jgi:hypothetical protein|nr:hypothetical protein [Deltaproteobacteria bacterium]